MGIALAVAGVLLIVTGVQNTYGAMGAQLQKDFTGQGNFTWWFLAIIMVGILGYIPALKQFSRWFLALIFIALLFSHKGFFANLTSALKGGPKASPQTTSANSPSALPTATPAQGVAQGKGGVGVNWNPFSGLFGNLFGGSGQ